MLKAEEWTPEEAVVYLVVVAHLLAPAFPSFQGSQDIKDAWKNTVVHERLPRSASFLLDPFSLYGYQQQ